MARQEIRTRRGDEVPFLPSSFGEKSWLPLFECLSIDALQIKNRILSWKVFQGRLLEIKKLNTEVQWRKQEKEKKWQVALVKLDPWFDVNFYDVKLIKDLEDDILSNTVW